MAAGVDEDEHKEDVVDDEEVQHGDEDKGDDKEVCQDMFANVVPTAENWKFDGFHQLFVDQLRPLLQSEYDVAVHLVDR